MGLLNGLDLEVAGQKHLLRVRTNNAHKPRNFNHLTAQLLFDEAQCDDGGMRWMGCHKPCGRGQNEWGLLADVAEKSMPSIV